MFTGVKLHGQDSFPLIQHLCALSNCYAMLGPSLMLFQVATLSKALQKKFLPELVDNELHSPGGVDLQDE